MMESPQRTNYHLIFPVQFPHTQESYSFPPQGKAQLGPSWDEKEDLPSTSKHPFLVDVHKAPVSTPRSYANCSEDDFAYDCPILYKS